MHMFDCTVEPSQLVASNCQPGMSHCRHCFRVPVADWAPEFFPNSTFANLSLGQGIPFQYNQPKSPNSASGCSTYVASPSPSSVSAASTVSTQGSTRATQSRAIFVKGLHSRTTETELNALMTKNIGAPISMHFNQGGKKPHAIIDFEDAAQAAHAVTRFHGYVWKDWRMEVRHDKSQSINSSHASPPARESYRAGKSNITSGNPPIADGSSPGSGPHFQSRR